MWKVIYNNGDVEFYERFQLGDFISKAGNEKNYEVEFVLIPNTSILKILYEKD